MKGKIRKFVAKRGYGWIEPDVWFHINDLADRRLANSIKEGMLAEFDLKIPGPDDKGSAVEPRTLVVSEAPAVLPSALPLPTPAPLPAPNVPNANDAHPAVGISHKETSPGYLDLYVQTGRANDPVEVFPDGKEPKWIPKPLRKKPFLTASDGIVKFVIPLTEKQYQAGALPITVLVCGEPRSASWSRGKAFETPMPREAPAHREAPVSNVRTEEPTWNEDDIVSSIKRDAAGNQDTVIPDESHTFATEPTKFVVHDITPPEQRDFAMIEIIGLATVNISSKKKWEIALRPQGELDWKIGPSIPIAVQDKLVLDVRIEKRPAGQFGSDHIVVESSMNTTGEKQEIYLKPYFILNKEVGPSPSTSVH